MTADAESIVPMHRDYARALRGMLAALGDDIDAVVNLAAETTTAREVDRFMLALLDTFAGFAKRKLKDPVSYFEQWVALELELADAEESGPR
jgi:hypothetical protein